MNEVTDWIKLIEGDEVNKDRGDEMVRINKKLSSLNGGCNCCCEWISVKDRLPESDDILCLIWASNDYEIAWWYEGTGCWDDPEHGWTDGKLVTHWMPLPEPPECQ